MVVVKSSKPRRCRRRGGGGGLKTRKYWVCSLMVGEDRR